MQKYWTRKNVYIIELLNIHSWGKGLYRLKVTFHLIKHLNRYIINREK